MIKYILFLCFLTTSVFGQSIYEVKEGNVKFYSDAPQELIKAYSGDLKGIVDFSKKTFAFKIGISSFEGFNSPLQREHFNENYLETNLYPVASFSGKIIEDVDIKKNGTCNVRAKGKLKIHGVEQERIIRSSVIVRNNKIIIQSEFIVLLADHLVKIPRVVSNKLSQEINVSIDAELDPKK